MNAHNSNNNLRFQSVVDSIMMQSEGTDLSKKLKSASAKVKRVGAGLKPLKALSGCPELVHLMLDLPEDLRLRLSEIPEARKVALSHEKRLELEKHFLRPYSRVLIEGPPGTGKTSAAVLLGESLGVPTYSVQLSQIVRSHLGETAKILSDIFTKIRDTRCVCVFDEIDSIGSKRRGVDSADSEMARTTNSLLQLLDQSKGTESVIVATTNRADLLDLALFRRFDLIIKLDNPPVAQLQILVKSLLGDLPCVDIDSFDWTKLAGTSPSILATRLAGAKIDHLLEGKDITIESLVS